MFEWQSHSQKYTGVSHYNDLFQFSNLRAQATQAHNWDQVPRKPHKPKVNSGKKCKVCQRPYHTLFHLDQQNISLRVLLRMELM